MWVTPSQNRIFKFTFPTSASQVAVTSKSPDDICLTVSVQSPQVSRSLISFVFHFRTYIEWLCFFNFFNFKCPVFDTIYNVEYEGFRQTMTGQSTIIVQVRIFKYRRYSVFRLGKFLGNTLIPFWGGGGEFDWYMTRVQRNQYPEGFYLVYIVNTNDEKCVNSRIPAPFRANRTKEVTFTIQETVPQRKTKTKN